MRLSVFFWRRVRIWERLSGSLHRKVGLSLAVLCLLIGRA